MRTTAGIYRMRSEKVNGDVNTNKNPPLLPRRRSEILRRVDVSQSRRIDVVEPVDTHRVVGEQPARLEVTSRNSAFDDGQCSRVQYREQRLGQSVRADRDRIDRVG